jgi:hypothetical protein
MTTTNTLFSAGQGVAVPTGFLGAVKIATIAGIATGSMPAAGTVVNIGTLSLTPGFYIIYGQVGFNSGATTSATTPDVYFTASISAASATELAATSVAGSFVSLVTASRNITTMTYVNNTATNTYYLVSRHGATTIGVANYSSSSVSYSSQFYAIQLS